MNQGYTKHLGESSDPSVHATRTPRRSSLQDLSFAGLACPVTWRRDMAQSRMRRSNTSRAGWLDPTGSRRSFRVQVVYILCLTHSRISGFSCRMLGLLFLFLSFFFWYHGVMFVSCVYCIPVWARVAATMSHTARAVEADDHHDMTYW